MKPEVVVVGAGPAGISAALALAGSGASVTLVDEQEGPGGQVYRAVDRVKDRYPDSLAALGEDYVRGADLTALLAGADVTVRYSTSVWDIAGGASPRLGIVNDSGASTLHPDHIVLAVGAMERPMPFPGWTLPGVMGVGAAQTLLKTSGLLPEGGVVLAGTGPLIYLFARQMLAAGGRLDAILDTAPSRPERTTWTVLARAAMADSGALLKGIRWIRQIRRAGISHINNIDGLKAQGHDRVESVVYIDGKGQEHEVECDLLLIHDGVIPNTHVSMAAGCEHHWNPQQRYWYPVIDAHGRSSVQGISICGDQGGILGADAAEVSGRITGTAVAAHLGLIGMVGLNAMIGNDLSKIHGLRKLRCFLDAHFLPMPGSQIPADDATLICRCEQVTAGDIRRVAAHGCMGPNQGKAFTRCGMGPCMGRYCGNTVSQLLGDFHGRPVDQIGHYRIRPPLKPLTVGQLATLDSENRG